MRIFFRYSLFFIVVLLSLNVQAQTYNVANGDVAGLITAINSANTDGGNSIINLAVGGTYTLTVVNNTGASGDNGLPIILLDGTLTINGNGATISRGAGPNFRIFELAANANFTANNLRITNGFATATGGGAILGIPGSAVTLNTCTIENNQSAVNSSAILVTNTGTSLVMNRCTVRNNAGSGVFAVGGATFTINNSTISGNGGNGINTTATDNCSITNSTISGNGVNGILWETGTLNLINCTIANNATAGFTFGIGTPVMNYQNCIFANGTNIAGAGTATNQGGSVLAGFPVVWLAALADNGSFVQTHALLGGSPAINAGVNMPSLPPAIDQRGASRIGQLDAGAFEFNGVLPTVVTNTQDDGFGSLRQAIRSANFNGGAQTISFNIPIADPNYVAPHWTITLASILPSFTTPINLDGTSQTGYVANTSTTGNNAVLPIILNANGTGHGLILNDATAANSTIQGIRITNWGTGVGDIGILVGDFGNATGSTIRSCVIDNGYIGISIPQTTNTTIGGIALADRCEITNCFTSISLNNPASIGNRILGNLIYANTGTGIGIDINADGVTTNGPNPRILPNQGQNFPTLASAIAGATNTIIAGVLNSQATRNYRIEFFSSVTPNLSGNGGGENYLGFINVTTDGTGSVNFNYTHPAVLPAGLYISATATDLTANNTSEFAINVNVVPSVFVVNSTGDQGDVALGGVLGDGICGNGITCTLRAAIEEANAFAGTQTIAFGIPIVDPNYFAAPTPYWSIRPLSFLPVITETLIIDGWSQTGFSGTPLIEINGVNLSNSFGLNIQATDCEIRGLVINNFNSGGGGNDVGIGIFASVPTNMNNWIYGCYIGTDITGAISVPNDQIGIWINTNANSNLIGTNGDGINDIQERNIISGNGGYGTSAEIRIQSTDNIIKGNYIGINRNGTADISPAQHGLWISNGNGSIIGGTSAVERNVIGGVNQNALVLQNSSNCTVKNNYLGTNASGTASIPNNIGILIQQGSSNNVIGGTSAADRNLISGNSNSGIFIQDIATQLNQIQGNYIGTNASGTAAIGNNTGISVFSPNNIIGGTVAGAGNLISGNPNANIGIFAADATNNLIQGNYIGTNASGTAAISGATVGISLNGSSNTTVGGTTAGAGNIISGSSICGIRIFTSNDNTIQGNYIGTNVVGTAAIPNSSGILIENGASNNLIGGTVASARNIISGNTQNGISISSISTSNNQIAGNYIGTDATGSNALANGFNGILLNGAGTNNTIGGTVAAAGNVISGNTQRGIFINQTSATQVKGNYIGTVATGTSTLGNALEGIFISNSSNNIIGGSTINERNIISGNQSAGISIIALSSGNSSNNAIKGNYIGTDVSGNLALPNNGNGISISDFNLANTIVNNSIGGIAPNEGNVIAYNLGDGINLSKRNALSVFSGNLIAQNSIFANQNSGIDLAGDSADGITPNDPQDTDTGANALQNYPNLSASFAPIGTFDTQIQGTFNSTPSSTFAVEFFANPVNERQGKIYLGTATFSTDANGDTIFDITIPNKIVPNGYYITATATNLSTNNTSEFAAQIQHVNTNTPQNIVTNTNDSGAGSLRNAMEFANFNVGLDTIKFDIPNTDAGYVVSGDYFSIKPISPLPTLTDQVVIDGYSQVGSTSNNLAVGNNAKLRIEVDFSNSSAFFGFALNAPNSVIKGLVINNLANGYGIIFNSPNCAVQGCFIGTDVSGLASKPNSYGMALGNNTIVGGFAPEFRNLISGNGGAVVCLVGAGVSGSIIQGNYIGTNRNGTASLPNGLGIDLYDANSNTIGGTSVGAGNLISGNGSSGILIRGSFPLNNNIIQGNLIGTNASGTAALANGGAGIYIEGTTASNNIIGGNTAGARNIISGNFNFGIRLVSGASNNIIQGNYIGTNSSGSAGIANQAGGIYIDSPNNLIGGTLASARNVISSNFFNGILLQGTNANGNSIQGNYIGIAANGTTALGNSLGAVRIDGGASNNTIGGTVAGAGNILANSTDPSGYGVAITGAGSANNPILGNRIFNNGQLGIDLGADGVTFNDTNDLDVGENDLQNFPTFVEVFPIGSNLRFINFGLNTTDGNYRLEFFSNTVADPSGYGEGQNYLGFTNVTVTGNNFTSPNFDVPITAPLGSLITVTATNLATNNTSEFSQAVGNCKPVITSVTDVSYATCTGLRAFVRFTASNAPDGTYSVDLGGGFTTSGTMTSGIMTLEVPPGTLVDDPTITHTSGCTSDYFLTTFNLPTTGIYIPPDIQSVTLVNPTRCDKPDGKIIIAVSAGSAGQAANVDINNDGTFDFALVPINANNQIIIDGLEGGIAVGNAVRISLPLLSCVSPPFSFSGVLEKLPLPDNTLSLSINLPEISPNTSASIGIINSQPNISYQLRNVSSQLLIKEPIVSSGGTLTLTTEVLDRDATYEIIAQNTTSKCTSIFTQKVKIKVVYGLHPDDSLALAEVYREVTGIPWDPSKPLSKWERVTVKGGRVTVLNLSRLNLKGRIPESILKLKFLTLLLIQDNFYQFTSFERFFSLGVFFAVNYSPQFDVLETKDTTALERSNVNFDSKIEGANNRYQWYKDGVPIGNNPTASTSYLRLSKIGLEAEGAYTCLITNPQAPLLTLRRGTVNLTVRPLAVNPTDSLILVKFAQGLGIENWTKKWDFTKQVATWEGLVFEKGNVVGINLINNNLKGSIPDVFVVGNNIISKLRILNLSQNQISGLLPPSLALLTELEYLDLSSNQLEGTLNPNIFNIKSLVTLWLSYNKLNKIEKGIGNLTNLKNLFLNDNELTELPEEINNLTNLEILNLQNNNLKSLPNGFANLQKLKFLDISNNELSAMPLGISSLKALEILLAHNNFIKTLSVDLLNLDALRQFSIYNNLLEFGSLEPLRIWWTSKPIKIAYAPQGKIGTFQEILTQIGQNVIFTLQTSGTANRYQWFKNDNSIANAVNVNFSIQGIRATDAGIYTVQVRNNLVPDLILQSENYVLLADCSALNAGNKPKIQIEGATLFCGRESINTRLLASTTEANVTFQWLLNGIKIGNANQASLAVKDEGRYRVQSISPDGCTYTSDEVIVTVSPEYVVNISKNGDVLEAISDRLLNSFEWFLNGNLLPNEISKSIIAKESGTYFVRVTDRQGCVSISRNESITITGIEETDLQNSMVLFPNPSQEIFYLQSKKEKILSIKIYDALGRSMSNSYSMISPKELKINLKGQATGIYWVEIQTEKNSLIKKIVKE
ncbi:choice-of-anchor Q domain-containing protein [Thermoflexibacter ruber]|nr:choice-of-anchor Q domain-containing protein [Thermoflexibacter ruber]